MDEYEWFSLDKLIPMDDKDDQRLLSWVIVVLSIVALLIVGGVPHGHA